MRTGSTGFGFVECACGGLQRDGLVAVSGVGVSRGGGGRLVDEVGLRNGKGLKVELVGDGELGRYRGHYMD